MLGNPRQFQIGGALAVKGKQRNKEIHKKQVNCTSISVLSLNSLRNYDVRITEFIAFHGERPKLFLFATFF